MEKTTTCICPHNYKKEYTKNSLFCQVVVIKNLKKLETLRYCTMFTPLLAGLGCLSLLSVIIIISSIAINPREDEDEL